MDSGEKKDMSLPVDECELPSDWSVSSVSEVATFSRGVSWRKVEEVLEGEGLQVVSIPNIKDGWIDYKSKFNHYLSKEVSAAKRLNVGDIVFVGSSGSVHNVGRNARISSLPNGSVAFASFTFKAAPKPDKIDEDFLYFLVNSEMVPFPDFCKRAADGKFNFQLRDFASRLRIPLPPLFEQKKIAHILSTVQQAIEAQGRIIQTTTELKKNLMHKLFTEGLHNEPQKQTEIGPVPESWEESTLGDIALFSTGGTPSRKKKEFWEGGTIPWVKTGEINYRPITATEESITERGMNESNAKLFPKGTLLIAMYGQGITRGRVGLLGIDATTNQACAAIKPHGQNKIKTEYLYFFLEYFYEELRSRGHGANQKNLSITLLKMFPVAFPDENTQSTIVTALKSLDAKVVLTMNRTASYKNLFCTLLHCLMTAKTRVYKF